MTKRLFAWLLIGVLCFLSSLAFSQSGKLTKEQIIQIASSKAKELGYKTEKMRITYDDGNKLNKKHFTREGESIWNEKTKKWDKVLLTTVKEEYPELNGKHYQSVYFSPKKAMLGGDLWIFVDRDTGEVIKHVAGE